MEIEGKIIQDLGVQSGVSARTGNPWKKQEWLLETFGNFPRKVKFTVFGEQRIDQMKLAAGENYRISVDIESREYQGRYYTDVNAYAAVRLDGSMPQPGQEVGMPPMQQAPANPFGAPQQAPGASVNPFAAADNSTDDLPF